MPISWNEIRQNAIRFSRDWAGARSETAEKQTFWNDFFEVFGVRRRVVAAFEEPVKNLSGDYGYIDLFWRGMLLVEHKSFGKDLGKAESQAFRYIQDLQSAGRTDEVPRYVIVRAISAGNGESRVALPNAARIGSGRTEADPSTASENDIIEPWREKQWRSKTQRTGLKVVNCYSLSIHQERLIG